MFSYPVVFPLSDAWLADIQYWQVMFCGCDVNLNLNMQYFLSLSFCRWVFCRQSCSNDRRRPPAGGLAKLHHQPVIPLALLQTCHTQAQLRLAPCRYSVDNIRMSRRLLLSGIIFLLFPGCVLIETDWCRILSLSDIWNLNCWSAGSVSQRLFWLLLYYNDEPVKTLNVSKSPSMWNRLYQLFFALHIESVPSVIRFCCYV